MAKITPSLNDQLMVMAAHRYCLGSHSYIVSSCIEWIEKHWDTFSLNTQQVIVQDTIRAIMDNRAGGETIDVPDWRRLAQQCWNKLPAKQKERVLKMLNCKIPWPLEDGQDRLADVEKG